MNNNTIILNPQEYHYSIWENEWKDLVTFEDYMSIVAQREGYNFNAKGYETDSIHS